MSFNKLIAKQEKNFPKLLMSRFNESFRGMRLTSMHSTNPQPFAKIELEQTIGISFSEILENVSLGFAADEGSFALRQTLAEYHYDKISPDNVVAHAGAQEALFCAFNALLESEDKVLVLAPVFEPLLRFPQGLGCEVQTIELSEIGWKLDLQKIEEKFKQGCRLFVSNFPHNPTGVNLNPDEFNQLVQLCKTYDVWWLSDEVFRGLEHDENSRLPAVADIYEKGISIGVISKAFAVPGIRIGWLACPNQKFLQRVVDVKAYLSVCNSQIDEALAAEILKYPDKLLSRNLMILLKNKELIKSDDRLFGEEVRIVIPESGCSLFAVLKKERSCEFVNKVADEYGYLLYPSSLFATKAEGFRMGFGSSGFKDFIVKAREKA